MLRLPNRGLNFSILPHKLDITQTLDDFRKYERTVIWHEYHYGKENNNKEPNDIIFREEKTSLPKNYSIPEGLKVLLNLKFKTQGIGIQYPIIFLKMKYKL